MSVAWDSRIVDREVDMQVERTRQMKISPSFTLVMLQVKARREVTRESEIKRMCRFLLYVSGFFNFLHLDPMKQKSKKEMLTKVDIIRISIMKLVNRGLRGINMSNP